MQGLNATVVSREEVSPDLCVLRVRPEGKLFDFEAGQFAGLGLPVRTPRISFSDAEEDPVEPDKLIRRAYSISSSSKQKEYAEFYISLVRSGLLTPRLLMLQTGDRLWMGPKATGHFTLNEVPEDKDLILVSTGTGLAPYLSMIRSAHRCHEGRHYTVVHGARHTWDLGYRGELEALNHGCGTFKYVPTLTRPESREGWAGHIGRVQSVFEDGTVGADPNKAHVFLCGSPEMVESTQTLLEACGYTQHSSRNPGTLHIERYW